MYELSPAAQIVSRLFFRMEKDESEHHGVIGYMRIDFGRCGNEFWSTWFDIQANLKTPGFKKEFDDIINSLRFDGASPPFANRKNLSALCGDSPGMALDCRGNGYVIRTSEYSYYFRCLPRPGDYNVFCFAYDNRCLLPELTK